MPLKLVVDAIDSIPESLRGEYEEKDGKFHLKVDGLEDTSGLKTALQNERTANKSAKELLKSWETLGMSREEVEELMHNNAEAAAAAMRKKGDFDGLLKQHQDKWVKTEKELRDEVEAARKNERSAVVDGALAAALAKESATDDGLVFLPTALAGRVVVETIDGKRVTKVVNADGSAMAGSGPGGMATIDDLVKEAKTKHPGLFKGSGAAGGGKDPGGKGGGGADGITSKRQFKTERERAAWVDKNGHDAYQALAD